MIGEKGDTGRVELKRAGAAENLFERGQTDYFTLDAADVGKVRTRHELKELASSGLVLSQTLIQTHGEGWE